ncbi:MAG: glycosyltransferase family 39 protein, partial [Thermodesulfobacteriota bacterium]
WPDVIVDFGREVYVPWRITEGDVLYRDLQYWNGPLSPYVNSLIFRVFGASIMAVEAANLLVIAAITWLAYALFSRRGGRGPAAAACAVFLALFAFAQYYWTGNFNFMAPYSHELTHGTLIALAGIYALARYLERRAPVFIFAVGLAAGLALLTKLEVTLGVAGAATTGLALVLWTERPRRARLARILALFLAGLFIPVLFFVVYLGQTLGVGAALRGIFGSWLIVTGTDVSAGKFQRDVMGTSDVAGNILRMLYVTLWYLALLVPVAVGYLLRRSPFIKAYGPVLSFVVTAGILLYFMKAIPWLEVARPLPLFVSTITLALFAALAAGRFEAGAPARYIPMISFGVFSLAMLLKMVLNVHVPHYGFALAMPAALLTVHALLAWAPGAVERARGPSGVFRSAVYAAVLVMAVRYATLSAGVYSMKNYTVRGEAGGDVVVGYDPGIKPDGAAVEAALKEIAGVMAPGETFAVLPEGVMLNYLARRMNPTGFINFVPSELTMFGEGEIQKAFETRPPDYVILAHKDTSDYGPRFFGRDYGTSLYGWIVSNYSPFHLIGAPPLRSDRFGILILKRRGP